jgi:hypothetical protein
MAKPMSEFGDGLNSAKPAAGRSHRDAVPDERICSPEQQTEKKMKLQYNRNTKQFVAVPDSTDLRHIKHIRYAPIMGTWKLMRGCFVESYHANRQSAERAFFKFD